MGEAESVPPSLFTYSEERARLRDYRQTGNWEWIGNRKATADPSAARSG